MVAGSEKSKSDQHAVKASTEAALAALQEEMQALKNQMAICMTAVAAATASPRGDVDARSGHTGLGNNSNNGQPPSSPRTRSDRTSRGSTRDVTKATIDAQY